MEYRVNKRTGEHISVIGIGSSYISAADEKEAVSALTRAYESGINFFDMAADSGKCFPYYGKALSDVRNDVLYQVHFGADYSKVAYGWSLKLDDIKKSIDWQLGQLKTDYIDYGFIHCIDESSDWKTYQNNGILDYILELKEQGVIRHIGASSHTPSVLEEIIDIGMLDIVMFSINPGYDYQIGDYANGEVDERNRLYRRCEAEGIGISVMKPFSGGQLLDDRLSPFGKALTRNQCIKYALDKPGVVTVLAGISSVREVEQLLTYFDATDQEKDYSMIGSYAPESAIGKCVYCNHCQPCPVGLDIALINKYYDLARVGDDLAKVHYHELEKKAEDCIRCGHCNSRCPFKVDQMGRLIEIRKYM